MGPGRDVNDSVRGAVSEVGHGVALALPWQNDGPCTAAGTCPEPEAAAIWAALPKAVDTDARAGSGRSTVGARHKACAIACISTCIFSEAATQRSIPVAVRVLEMMVCEPGGGRTNEPGWSNKTDRGEMNEPVGGGGGGASSKAAVQEQVWRVKDLT